jgi:hypothetical protein
MFRIGNGRTQSYQPGFFLDVRDQQKQKKIDNFSSALQNTKENACLKLFIDYHGLNILWSWMIDIDRQNDMLHNNLKLKILSVLDVMPVKNRAIIEECKLDSIVRRWFEEKTESRMQKINDFNSLFSKWTFVRLKRESKMNTSLI